MRYSEISFISENSQLAKLFNGAQTDALTVDAVISTDSSLRGDHLLYNVSTIPGGYERKLVVVMNPLTNILRALVVYCDQGSPSDSEEFFNCHKIIQYLHHTDCGKLAAALESCQVKSMMDESVIRAPLTINEAPSHDSWAILPATMELYGKRTVDVLTAASTWQPSATTILICSKLENTGKTRIVFVASSGDAHSHYVNDIGKSFETHHDQTGVSKGRYKLENIAVVKNQALVKSANSKYLDVKASLSVFK